MEFQGNIEINSSKSNTSYSNIKSEESFPKPNSTKENIMDKFQTIKNYIHFGSFTGDIEKQKTNTSTNITDNSNGIQSVDNQTCREKVVEKISSSLEIERNIPVFLGLIGVGCGLIVLSIFLLPFVVISPHKFCLCFAFGGLLITLSFLFLKGTQNYFKSICAKDRFIITILYLVSIVLGIGFALKKKYIFSVLCAIYQCIALVLFILSFIPGGKFGINCINNFFTSPFTKLWASSVTSQLGE